MQNAPRIFLSYAREDRPVVENLYRRLRDAGFRPWMDIEDIRAGERWEPAIYESISKSDFFIVCLSNHSISKKRYVQREIAASLETAADKLDKLYLIPVRLEECEIPEQLAKFQFIDLFAEGGWERLLKAIEVGLAQNKTEVSRLKKSLDEEKRKPKSHVFVAMPFSEEMEDVYFYGIMGAVAAAGFVCKRVDKDAFVGDILQEIRKGIETSVAVVADLSGANPNVYLEVGYAWGKQIPTILIIRENHELGFDVRGQRCLKYDQIKSLEESLTAELERLKSQGIIGTKTRTNG